MKDQNPENGRIPAATGRAVARKAELKVFLNNLDLARQTQWQNLLKLQAEQLRMLASWIETKLPMPMGVGPDLSGLGHHRNARERIDQPLGANAPVSRDLR
jgi:phage FluMu gp28-like protein